MVYPCLRRGNLCCIAPRRRGMKLLFCCLSFGVNDCHQNFRFTVIVFGLICDLRLLSCCHHIHAVLPHRRISGGIIYNPFPELHIIFLSCKSAAPLSGDIAVPRRSPSQSILPHGENRISFFAGNDQWIRCSFWCCGDISIQSWPSPLKKTACQLMSPLN